MRSSGSLWRWNNLFFFRLMVYKKRINRQQTIDWLTYKYIDLQIYWLTNILTYQYIDLPIKNVCLFDAAPISFIGKVEGCFPNELQNPQSNSSSCITWILSFLEFILSFQFYYFPGINKTFWSFSFDIVSSMHYFVTYVRNKFTWINERMDRF